MTCQHLKRYNVGAQCIVLLQHPSNMMKEQYSMLIDSSLIGKSSAPQTFEVTREAVLRFMEAAEDPALDSGTPIEYAPPTFPTTFRMRVPGLELDTTKMQLLHGEQEYNYVRRLRIGEKETCVVR